MLLLGEQAPRVLVGTPMLEMGHVAHGVGVVAAAILWGFGLWWGNWTLSSP